MGRRESGLSLKIIRGKRLSPLFQNEKGINHFVMDALGGFWGLNGFNHRRKKNNSSGDRRNQRKSGSSDSVDVSRDAAGYHFPLKQAVTAGALTFTGDTIAQLSGRWKKRAAALKQSSSDKPDQVCLNKVSSLSFVYFLTLLKLCLV